MPLCVPVLLDGPFGVRRGVLRNLSERGAFVETLERYPVGAQVKVVFSLPGSFVEIVAMAEVRHVDADEAHPAELREDPAEERMEEPAGIGVLFTGFVKNADELAVLPTKLRDLPT